MNRRKYKIGISSLLICAMLGTTSLPIFAEEMPTPIAEQNDAGDATTSTSLAIDINANYYSTDTEGNYKVIFTTLSDLPAFTELTFKIQLTDANVLTAAFEEKLLTEGDSDDTLRGKNSADCKLTRTTAEGIAAKTAFFNLEITNSQVPSASVLSVSEFSLTDLDEKTISVTPTVTFQAGPIVPTLNEEEQKAYDLLVALPEAEDISFYAEDGTPLSLSNVIAQVAAAKTAYTSLSATSKENVGKVLEYYNYSTNAFEELNTVLDVMDKAKGLIEIAYTLKDVTIENILEYQYLLNVYASVKTEIDISTLPAGTVAAQELNAADEQIVTSKALLTTKLENTSLEALTYACEDQIGKIQTMSSHLYYNKYLHDVSAQIDALADEIKENYEGYEQTKNSLLSYLESYKNSISLIQKGIDDLPKMSLEEIVRGNRNTITFNRTSTLDNTINASILVIITDEDGKEKERQEATFPSDKKKLEVSFTATRTAYSADEVVTVTSYYIIDGATFPLDSKQYTCVTRNTTVSNTNPLPSTDTSTSTSGSSSVGSSSSGGTIFPSDVTVEPEENTTSTLIFNDIANYDWAKEAIEGLYYAGIINGMEEGIFNPAGLVTREQFAKMVVQLFGVATGSTYTNFVDVNENGWYAPYITAALQAGYIQGQSQEYFGIGESIMRQDMATILYRALGDQNSKAVLSFTDVDNIAGYAEDAIAELVGLGVLNGYEDGSFKPRGTATRAEAAKTIWGIYQILHN
ncbi:MAG: S-layer homology domain-containing protein [Clostridia bacterium]|nr:S-layer homology domain-containing protein [Clostridia bacterium]